MLYEKKIRNEVMKKEILAYNILGFIMVRTHGSYGKRCLWNICGRPMLYWSTKALLDSPYINKVIVATEDDEVIELARSWGCSTFKRPLYTTTDSESVIHNKQLPRAHAFNVPRRAYQGYWVLPVEKLTLAYLREKENYMTHLLLRAEGNCPLGRTETINRMVKMFFHHPDTMNVSTYYLRPYVDVWAYNPRMKKIDRLIKTVRDRQHSIPLYGHGPYHLQGESVGDTRAGKQVMITEEEGLEVHDEEELFKARCYMKRRLEGNDEWLKK